MVYGNFTAADAHVAIVEAAASNGKYRDVLNTLGSAIHAAESRATEAASAQVVDDDDWRDAVVDDECELIESLLGATFVVCQSQITAVASRALHARKYAVSKRLGTPKFSDGLHHVRSLGDMLSHYQFSTVDAIWQLANFFKHREEMSDSDWTTPAKHQKAMVDVIAALGLKSSTTGNFRTGAQAILNGDTYSKTQLFGDAIDEWSKKVVTEVRRFMGR